MKIQFAVFKSYSNGQNRYSQFLNSVNKNGKLEDWTATSKFSKGDLTLFYFGAPQKAIISFGIVASDPVEYEGPFDWTNKQKETFCNYNPVWLIENPLILHSTHNRKLRTWYNGKPYRSPRELDKELGFLVIQEILKFNPEMNYYLSSLGINIPPAIKKNKIDSDLIKYREGSIREITLELKKRDPRLRSQAIVKYGYNCQVCGFNFEDFYGDLGSGYIEVHHLKPLSEKNEDSTTSVEDVSVVCANCHRILHHKGTNSLTISELKKVIANINREVK